MATLGNALDAVRADPALAKEFTADPTGVLKRLGVDTSKLKVSKVETVPQAGVATAICVSVGCIACVSIG
jgi:hypothetical protein